MVLTACDGRATSVRRAGAPTRRFAAACPCPAPLQRSAKGIRRMRAETDGNSSPLIGPDPEEQQ